jgi:hypothetical protein
LALPVQTAMTASRRCLRNKKSLALFVGKTVGKRWPTD